MCTMSVLAILSLSRYADLTVDCNKQSKIRVQIVRAASLARVRMIRDSKSFSVCHSNMRTDIDKRTKTIEESRWCRRPEKKTRPSIHHCWLAWHQHDEEINDMSATFIWTATITRRVTDHAKLGWNLLSLSPLIDSIVSRTNSPMALSRDLLFFFPSKNSLSLVL